MARHFTLLFLVLSLLPATAEIPARDGFASARKLMVDRDIESRGVSDLKVLSAMRKVPRHLFVPANLRNKAYADHPLPIGEGQTISQPYIVALMTEALMLKGDEKVLEIGTGSGYQAAVLAEIVPDVCSIEIRAGLAESAHATLQKNGYGNVRTKTGDGYFGWPEHAPFDAIIVTAAANHIPPPLIDQLKDGGKLVIPVGPTTYTQYLTLVVKEKDSVRVYQMAPVVFVPMIGEVRNPRADSDAAQ